MAIGLGIVITIPPEKKQLPMPQLEPNDGDSAEPAAVGEALPPAISSAELRRQATETERTISALHDAVSRTALASCGAPDDADLRRDADQALAILRDASDRLQQLTAAAELAERQEAEHATALATAARQREKDKLVRQQNRIEAKWDNENEALEVDRTKLAEETAALAEAERAFRDATLRVEVRQERIANRQARLYALSDQHLALDEQITAFPVTAQ
jgi:DNA repair exonuclease SbcCD ATPase subunit